MPGSPALLRPGLLDGTVVVAAGGDAPGRACARLGASVRPLDVDLLDEAAGEAAADPEADALVVDAAALHAADPLPHALDATWTAVRSTVNVAFIGPGRPGKIVLVAPRADAVPHAIALRAGIENLARTTSIEWARHRITPTAILPGPNTGDDEVAELVAYLISPAGDYFSGCALALN